MEKDMDALKLETQNLRGHIKDAALLEEQLNTVRAECDEIKKQRDSFMLQAQRKEENIDPTEGRMREAESRASWFPR
jgi:hypothetical protein